MSSARITAVLALLAAGLLYAGPAAAQQQHVQIFRGGKTPSILETREANVQVFRGTPIAFVREAPAVRPHRKIVSAGSRVWFVDRAANELTVCRLVATTQVGERRIDCRSGVLPY